VTTSDNATVGGAMVTWALVAMEDVLLESIGLSERSGSSEAHRQTAGNAVDRDGDWQGVARLWSLWVL